MTRRALAAAILGTLGLKAQFSSTPPPSAMTTVPVYRRVFVFANGRVDKLDWAEYDPNDLSLIVFSAQQSHQALADFHKQNPVRYPMHRVMRLEFGMLTKGTQSTIVIK